MLLRTNFGLIACVGALFVGCCAHVPPSAPLRIDGCRRRRWQGLGLETQQPR
jgi:hypothetical protein